MCGRYVPKARSLPGLTVIREPQPPGHEWTGFERKCHGSSPVPLWPSP